ncbi:S8 family serine peptidase [Aquimarina longa]|uniref:S8 family serine peptidase n=1 Tax=Aquimarina longa TaxID=1080221 RepID=UPI00078539C7|nr:S8 family serine peptidase [Aquimarina longa]
MKTQLRILSLVLIASLFFYSCEKDTDIIDNEATAPLTDSTIGADQAVSKGYIVVFKKDDSKSGKQLEMKAKSANTLKKYAIEEDNLEFTYSSVIQGFSVKNLSEAHLEKLKKDPSIAYIVPNYIHKLELEIGTPVSTLPATVQSKATTYDSRLPNGEFLPWGINRVGRANGSGKTCWIIDSGIAPHSDLNIDQARSRSFVGGSWQDQNGHGTHVAGTVAAKNNGSGVIGVAYGATVIAVRVLNAAGSGSDANIIAGVDYVRRNARNGDTWNYSIGFSQRNTSRAIEDAFRNLERTTYGAMAAGNSNDDTQYYSPQRLRTANSWCVGNMTYTDSPAGSSCYGRSVDRWAPGTNVWSTWTGGGFNKISGTSMASPHVAGILLLRGNSTATDGTIYKGGYTAPIATVR